MLAPTPSTNAQALIPRGVADYFWDEAYARREIEAKLLDLFRTWGYQDVITPMFEYADTFLNRASEKLRGELYRFLDRDGSTLALRADMTIPVARLVGVRLHDRPMPQRYCYAGSVFRHIETQAGRQREFTQAGFELIGTSAPAADAEVIALTIQAMHAIGLRDFRLILGQLQFFYALLQDLQLTPEQTLHLQHAIDRNSGAELDDFLRTTPLRTQQRHTVEQLPLLSGPDAAAVIAQADRLCLNYAMHKALANLRDIYHALEAHAVADEVYLDLTEINNLGYYTGISFELLIPGVGFSMGGGGRYDNLIGTFGAPQPAVGVALGVDRLLNALRAHTPTAVAGSTQPTILVATGDSRECFQTIRKWRACGLRVAVDMDGVRDAELWRVAQGADIALAATWTGSGFNLYGLASSAADQPTFIPATDAEQFAQQVLHGNAGQQQSALPSIKEENNGFRS